MSTQTTRTTIKKAKEVTNDRIRLMKIGCVSDCLPDKQKIRDNQRIPVYKGLFIQISHTGNHVFRFTYRDSEKKQKQEKIGRFDPAGDGINSFTVEQAKASYLSMIDKFRREGVEPRDASKLEKEKRLLKTESQGLTFKKYLDEWIDKQNYTQTHKAKVYDRILKNSRSILDKPLVSISERDIREILDSLQALNKQDTAHRLFISYRQMFHAAGKPVRDADDQIVYTADKTPKRLLVTDPTTHIFSEEYEAVKTRPFKHTTDISTLQKVLLAIDEYATGEPETILALKIAPHIFLRCAELRTMRWNDVDLEKGVWNLHKAKVRGRSIHDEDIFTTQADFSVPLSETVIGYLRQLKLYQHGDFVFSVRQTDEPISDSTLSKALRIILTKAGIPGATTVHGFRYTARSLIPAKFGVELRVIEQQLSHSTVKSSDKYGYDRYLYFAERRAMMNIWSEFLDGVKNKYREITQQEAMKLARTGKKTEWEAFVNKLKNSFQNLCRVFEQVEK